MLTPMDLKDLHSRSIKYSFKLPWTLVEENMPDIIIRPHEAMESMFRRDLVRLPFDHNKYHCFYPDVNLTMKVDGKSAPLPKAVCAIQDYRYNIVYITIFDENLSYLKHEGSFIIVRLCYEKGKLNLTIKKPPENVLPIEIKDKNVTILSENDVTDKVRIQIKLAVMLLAASLYALYFRESKECVNKRNFKRSTRQIKNKPIDHIIQISRKKYFRINNLLSGREGTKKMPHTRRGTWCTSKITGKQWWRRACKIHDGGDGQHYRI